MIDFELRWILICDYMSQLVDGKYVFSGVYTEDIVVGELEPKFFGDLVICLCLKPLVESFKLHLRVIDPLGGIILNTRGDMNAGEGVAIEDRDRIVLPVAFPRTDFRGFGRYTIQLESSGDEYKDVHSFNLFPPGG